MDDAQIKEMVRARYGGIAEAAGAASCCAPTCCEPEAILQSAPQPATAACCAR